MVPINLKIKFSYLKNLNSYVVPLELLNYNKLLGQKVACGDILKWYKHLNLNHKPESVKPNEKSNFIKTLTGAIIIFSYLIIFYCMFNRFINEREITGPVSQKKFQGEAILIIDKESNQKFSQLLLMKSWLLLAYLKIGKRN